MASIQQRGEKFQVRISHRLLPRPYFFTFATDEAARAYGLQADTLLKAGVVPREMVVERAVASPNMVDVIDDYLSLSNPSPSDRVMLGWVNKEVVGVRVSGLDYSWVEGYVRRLKVEMNLSPGTIRKRVGVLGRVLDWHLLKAIGDNSRNPLRMLPEGYSVYSSEDARLLKGKSVVKVEVARDRRLVPAEELRIRLVLAGAKREDRERAFVPEPDRELEMLFDLIINTGMRLLEAYRLKVDQIDFAGNVIRFNGSKGRRGKAKPRAVRLVPKLAEKLAPWCEGRKGLVFGYWDGSQDDLKKAGARLSRRFASLFAYAKVVDFKEHDLRHEATCRWVLMKDATGHWAHSDAAICRMMGWSNSAMLIRYASLRGEDL